MNKTSKNNLLSACTLDRHNCAWKCSQKLGLWTGGKFIFICVPKDTVEKRWRLIYWKFTGTAWTMKN